MTEISHAQARLPAISPGVVCQQCGYDLRGLTGSVCPECGRTLAGVRAGVSQIPWSRRCELGRFPAYWRTIQMVMFGQQAFCDELARPVDFVDAQRFRWMTILHAAGPVALALGLIFVSHGDRLVLHWRLPNTWWLIGLLAVLWVHFVLFLVAATGLPSYFFHPAGCPMEQQNRAIALSYYASGALTLMFAPALAMAIASPLPSKHQWQLLLQLLGWLLCLGIMAIWWLDLVHLTRRLVPQRPRRAWLVGVAVPLAWLALAVVILVVLPVVWGYIALAVSGMLL